jgi:hypothetical protein
MSVNISSVAAAMPALAARPAASPASRAAPAGHTDAAVNVDTFPSSPPPEVHDAMSVAAQSYKQLAKQDRELNFRINDATGKLTVEVHDLKGNLLFTVPASKALDVAAGGSLE